MADEGEACVDSGSRGSIRTTCGMRLLEGLDGGSARADRADHVDAVIERDQARRHSRTR